MTEVRLEPSAPPKSGRSSGKMQLELTGIGQRIRGAGAFDSERVDDGKRKSRPRRRKQRRALLSVNMCDFMRGGVLILKS